MHKALLGEKLAVLVANGFCEKDLTQIQRKLQPLGATMRIIGMDHGLVSSWDGHGWGLNFAADKSLSSALAADFSMLIVPGGQRSVEKLKLTAHTRRFISGFMDSSKPVVVFADALELLVFSERISGRRVTSPENLKDMAEEAGATWSDQDFVVDNNLMTVTGRENTRQEQAEAVVEFLMPGRLLTQAA